MTLKCLTVRQPWAGLIAASLKLVENRSLNPAHRGEIAIHASLAFDPAELEAQIRSAPFAVLGAVIAVADLTDCHTADLSDPNKTCCGPFGQRMRGPKPAQHWTLTNVRRLHAPVPWRGQLGLWGAPADVEAAVRRQLSPIDFAEEAS